MSSLTIMEAAKIGNGTVLERTIVEIFARSSPILRVLPFRNIPGNAVRYNREETLPGVAFRGINESYTPSSGVLNPIVESLVIAGGEVKVDNFIVSTEGASQRAVHEMMKIKALAWDWTDKFITGDPTSDQREFVGLQNRLTGTQLIPAGATSGGDALSLTVMDEAIDAVIEPNALVMSKAMARRFSQAARTPAVSGYVTYDQDEFGRRAMFYNDLPILVLEDSEGGDTILPFTEANPGGGTAASTSIYVCSFGPGRIHGIQNGDMSVRDLGEMETSPHLLTRIEWYSGIEIKHGRSGARLHGIKDAAIVA